MKIMRLMQKTIAEINGLDRDIMSQAQAHQYNLTKPRGSLGRLEELAVKICGIRRELHPQLKKKRVIVFAGDHGVVEEGVSAYPKEVSAQMVLNFLNGGAGINQIARVVGAEVQVVDIGVDYDFPELKGLLKRKVAKGTKNFTREPAMRIEETIHAIETGIELADSSAKDGISLIAGGDMGIGNTTPASALFCAYLGLSADEVVGPGTGITPETLKHKIDVVNRALQKHRDAFSDPLKTLSALGGLEIAGLAGLYLGAVKNRLVALVDGFIASSAALSAIKLCPLVKEHLIFSHLSEERGHRIALETMGVKPLLNLEMRLGEGTGACLAMALVDAALACHNQMATFQSAGVSDRK